MPPADTRTSISVSTTRDFDALYSEHMPVVLRYLRRRLGDSAGEDATHDVFARAFARRDAFDPSRAPVVAWLFGIAANVVADHRRHEARRLKAIERASRTGPRHYTDRDETPQLEAELSAGLRRLSLEDRETLLLVVWGELTYEETAVALNIPVGTVRSRVSRARKTLRAVVQSARTDSAVASTNGTTHA